MLFVDFFRYLLQDMQRYPAVKKVQEHILNSWPKGKQTSFSRDSRRRGADRKNNLFVQTQALIFTQSPGPDDM